MAAKLSQEKRLDIIERALTLNGHDLDAHAKALGYIEDEAAEPEPKEEK